MTTALVALFVTAPFLALALHLTRRDRAHAPPEASISEGRAAADLHFRALEALAQAIDSKDQTTPGHARRTQVYAVEMGKLLGLGPGRIEALRAGALLHDVGKLAVPDYILNKPGELTPAEFEKVKIHAAVGADIIGRVNFPYPVEEIIRHHHEKWDGTGYPAGLKGAEIPVAAQIIAVVDFYDASRCDRPYRAGITRAESLDLLRRLSGKSFAPRVVELFTAHVADFDSLIAPRDLSEQTPDRVRPGRETSSKQADAVPANEQHSNAVPPSGFHAIAEAQREVLALRELAQAVGSSLNLSDTLSLVAGRLAGIVAFDTCVVYVADEKTGGAVPVHACGSHAEFFAARGFAAGQGITGWVLANNRPMHDPAPGLDLSGAPAETAAQFRAALCAPLSREEGAFGAVALFSSTRAYTAEHLRLLESVCVHTSGAISNALTFERTRETALTDALTGLPNERALRLMLEQRLAECRRLRRGPVAVLCFDLDDFRLLNERHGFGVGDRLLAAAAGVIKNQLREMDTLSRFSGDSFVAVLPEAPDEVAALVAQRVRKAVESEPFRIRAGQTTRLRVSVGIASYPSAGETADDLILAATNQVRRGEQAREVPPARTGGAKVIRLDSFR